MGNQSSTETVMIVGRCSPARCASFCSATLKGLLDWPRDKAFIPPEQSAAPADLYVCHDPDALWLGIQYMDFAEPKLYTMSREFEQDLPSLRIDLPGSVTVTVAILANGSLRVSSPLVTARFIGRGTRDHRKGRESIRRHWLWRLCAAVQRNHWCLH
jgi:hypothetical protein